MPHNALVPILIKKLSHEQLHAILEAVTASYDYGECPLCGCEDVPVDENGKEIEEPDEDEEPEEPFEWQERHDEECPVSIIEKSFSPKGVAHEQAPSELSFFSEEE